MRMRAIGLAGVIALIAVTGASRPARAAEPLKQQSRLAANLDTSKAEWSRLEAAGDIELDADTGDFRIYYQGRGGIRRYWVFEPACKVEVVVEAEVSQNASGEFVYRYTVRNLASSVQNVDWFMVRYEGAEIKDIVDPEPKELWRSFPTIHLRDEPEYVVAWTGELPPEAVEGDKPGVFPGEAVSGLGFTSPHPPGNVSCYARGWVYGASIAEDAELAPDPRPNLFGDCVIGTTLGPVPATSSQTANGYLPFREALARDGWAVTWDHQRKEAYARKDGRTVRIAAGSRVSRLDGKTFALAVPARLVEGRLLAPRDFVESLAPQLAAAQR